uniref:Uncharacterized protein n=1 Tax=Vombatus ursinus TaxID=29139 RepID=A0A4X2KWM6_VOMUR
MCTTFFVLSTLIMLWRRYFSNQVHPPIPYIGDGFVGGRRWERGPDTPPLICLHYLL